MSAKHLSLMLALVLLVAACGGGATPEAPAAITEVPPTLAATEPPVPTLSLETFTYGSGSSDAMEMMIQWSTAELFMPQYGFTNVDIVVLDDAQILPALASGQVDMAQSGTNLFWAAMDQGDIDLVIVGFAKDDEVAILGARPGIASAADLVPGSTISGGDVGNWDELVLRDILTELGVDPSEMNIIATGGGADSRMAAMIAGQLDAGIQQPRNRGPLTAAGGVFLYEEARPTPQEAYAVTREMWNEHRDVVCAYMTARIQGLQWAAAGPERDDNIQQAIEIVMRHGIEPTEGELADWRPELEGNLSLDAGVLDAASIDNMQAGLQSLGILSEDFNWRDHTDFSCVWQAQAELGLPQRPSPY